MKPRDPLVDTLAAIVIVIALVGGIWTWTSGPCGLWTFAKAGDMPARCINQ